MPNPRDNRLTRLATVLLCAFGAWASGELLKAHAGPWPSLKGGAGYVIPLCGSGPGEQSGCATVLKSKFSSIDFRIPLLDSSLTPHWHAVAVPVAFLGLAYFVALGAWFALAGPTQAWGLRFYLIPLFTVAGGALASVGFIALMYLKLDAWCRWCLVIHGINALLVLSVFRCRPARARPPLGEERDVPHRDAAVYRFAPLTFVAAARVVAFAVMVICGMWLYRGVKLETRHQVSKLLPYKKYVEERVNDPAYIVREFYAQPEHKQLRQAAGDASSLDTPASSFVASPLGASSLVVFGDFQCPHCACFAAKWRTTLRKHWDGPIDVVFRHLPLDPSCNPAAGTNLHDLSCQASYAAEAARLQAGDAGFWRMHDHLYSHMRRSHPPAFDSLAKKVRLDGRQLLTDMSADAVRRRVSADIALAQAIGVHRTPAVFLDGRPVPDHYLHSATFWESISAHRRKLAQLDHSDRAVSIECGRSTTTTLCECREGL